MPQFPIKLKVDIPDQFVQVQLYNPDYPDCRFWYASIENNAIFWVHGYYHKPSHSELLASKGKEVRYINDPQNWHQKFDRDVLEAVREALLEQQSIDIAPPPKYTEEDSVYFLDL